MDIISEMMAAASSVFPPNDYLPLGQPTPLISANDNRWVVEALSLNEGHGVLVYEEGKALLFLVDREVEGIRTYLAQLPRESIFSAPDVCTPNSYIITARKGEGPFQVTAQDDMQVVSYIKILLQNGFTNICCEDGW